MKKQRSPKGTRSQKIMSFRLDNENTVWLNKQPNKGRYINKLIKEDSLRH